MLITVVSSFVFLTVNEIRLSLGFCLRTDVHDKLKLSRDVIIVLKSNVLGNLAKFVLKA